MICDIYFGYNEVCVKKIRKSLKFYILYHFYIEDLSNALITVNVFIFFFVRLD